MSQANPHLPVLLKETISKIFTNPSGIYLDGTVGYGGHSEKILKKLSPKGMLIGIDLDPYALEYAENRLSKIQTSYSLFQKNYREYPQLLQKLDIKKLTGILLDLGFSSSQINTEHRGFSFQTDAPLDMRYNPKSGISAFEFLNKSNVKEIGNNYYMNEFSAAIGLIQLKELDKQNYVRKKIAKRYFKEIQSGAKMPFNEDCSYHFYWILVKDRNEFRKKLSRYKIETGTHYKPIHTFSYYKSKTKLKITENVGKSIVTIPCHPNLRESDIDKIIKSINLLDSHFF